MSETRQINNGSKFTSITHHTPEGVLEPSNTKLPRPFVVLIAGGSRGIGLGIAVSYVKAGASTIIITGRSKASLDTAAQSLEAINPATTIVTRPCDATSESEVVGLAREIGENIGRLDVLVANVGAVEPTIVKPETGLRDFPWCISQEAKYSDFTLVMNTNVNAIWLCIHSFLPLLEATKDGAQTVFAISSAAAHYVTAGFMALSYSLSKFTETRLIEHVHSGHHQNGINAFALQPGGVKTELASDLPEGKGWEELLIDSPELAGAMCVWLTKEKGTRDWLSGRYIDARWDVETLVEKRTEIVEKDLLKFRMVFG